MLFEIWDKNTGYFLGKFKGETIVLSPYLRDEVISGRAFVYCENGILVA